MTKRKSRKEYVEAYFQVACNHINEEEFLDAWWMCVANTGNWYSSSTGKQEKLKDMTPSYLVNIKNLVLGLYEEKPTLPFGASKLVSLIDFYLMKKSKESDTEDLPF